jgi:hypothetical protein
MTALVVVARARPAGRLISLIPSVAMEASKKSKASRWMLSVVIGVPQCTSV